MFVCFYCYLSSAVIFFLIYLFVTAKAALPKKILVFAVRQIANNLSPIAKKLKLHFLAFRIISLERTSDNLACALQCFLCLFCPRFALLKTGHSNRNLTKKGLKIESFLQKTQKFFCVFFLRPPSKVTNFNTSPNPPFENFSLDTLNSEQKPSVKKQLTGPVRNRSTGRSTGDDFEIYRSGRIEKILTGSISVPDDAVC